MPPKRKSQPTNKKSERNTHHSGSSLGNTLFVKVSSYKEYCKLFPAHSTGPTDAPPMLDSSISTLSSNKLSDLYMNYSAWREFTEDLHSHAVYKFSKLKTKFERTWNILYLSTSGKTVKDKERIVSVNPEIIRLEDELEEAELMSQLLASKLNSFTNVLTTLSREITRRGLVDRD